MRNVNILGVRVDIIDAAGLQDAIARTIRLRRKDVYAYVNINAINIAQQDQRFRNFLNGSSVVYCDGEGVRLGARLLGVKLPPRVVLTYWIWDLCAFCEANGFTMFFLGATDDAVREAVANVKARLPRIRIVGCHEGYFAKSGFESERVVSIINDLKPDILIVGFGMPGQEHWIDENLQELQVKAVLPAGSMIDYTAGRKGLTPAWMANHGMEWLYRLFQEPARLWKRYLIGNPVFLAKVLLQFLREGRQQ